MDSEGSGPGSSPGAPRSPVSRFWPGALVFILLRPRTRYGAPGACFCELSFQSCKSLHQILRRQARAGYAVKGLSKIVEACTAIANERNFHCCITLSEVRLSAQIFLTCHSSAFSHTALILPLNLLARPSKHQRPSRCSPQDGQLMPATRSNFSG